MLAGIKQVAGWSKASSIEHLSASLENITITGVSFDTRKLAPGQLFVPLRGAANADGHDHVRAAVDAGAVAALWESGRPLPDIGIPLIVVDDTLVALQTLASGYLATLDAKVVAITGSNGKTTTKDLVASVLARRYRVHKTEGNFNNHIGLPVTILNAAPDTEIYVLEMGMSGRGEIALLASIAPPDVAVVTNIGESHLLQLGSRRNIARAKLEIAEGLKAGGLLIYNGDEPLLAEELPAVSLREGVRTVTFGAGEGNDLVAGDVVAAEDGTSFSETKSGENRFELRVPGKHNAVNALAAVAVGRRFGLPNAEIASGLLEAKHTGMRIERTEAANGAVVLNDAYNASPTSVKAAIDLASQLKGYKTKWLVLGDMRDLGPEENGYHAEIGRYLSPEKADRVALFGPLSAHIASEAKARFPAGSVVHYEDKQALAEALLRELAPGDLALVKASRGMKMEQVVAALQRGGWQ